MAVMATENMVMVTESTAMEKKKNGDNFVIPGETGQRKLKGSALGGFAKPDVDSYICALLGKAAELREKLCS